jgi:hypothetical protein
MGTMTSRRRIALVAAAAGLALALPGVAAQNEAIEEFTAFAINTNTRATQPQPNRPRTAQLDIRIQRWSTDEERDTLLAIVKKQDSNVNAMNQELLGALQRMPSVGRIREATTLGWDLRFARQAPLDEGGRRIVLATDRPMPHWEVRDRPRSFDYPFTVIEMRLDKENRGEGKLLADTRIFIDPRTSDLVLEHYDIQPVRLNEITARRESGPPAKDE